MTSMCAQEYGSPSKNGLGHSVTRTKHPLTQKMTKAVFVPDLKEGHWSGEFGNSSSVKHEQLLDDDRDAILQGQLEATMHVNQKALLQDLPAEACGVSMAEAEAKLKEEMKRKLAAEAALAEQNEEETGADQGSTESRNAKKRKTQHEDDEEEIGEDEEMLLAQAVSLGNDDGSDGFGRFGPGFEGSASAASCSPFTPGFQPVSFQPMAPMTPMTRSAPMTPGLIGGAATKVAKTSKQKRVAQQGPAAIPATPASPVASARGVSSPASASLKLAQVAGAVPLPQQLPSCPVPAAAGQAAASDEGTTDPAVADMEVTEQTQSTWDLCVRFDSLKLTDPASDVFKPPVSLKKDQQKAKWACEVGKILPWLPLLEKVLSVEQVKVTEHELKTAATQVRKVLARKLDKRMEYEKKNSKGEKLLSERVDALICGLETVKELRSMAFTCTKSATTFKPEALEELIVKFQTNMQILAGPDVYVALPPHWVQAYLYEMMMIDDDRSYQNILESECIVEMLIISDFDFDLEIR